MVAFGHVTARGFHVGRSKNQVALLVNPDEASFPEKSVGELDVHLPDVNGLMLGFWGQNLGLLFL